MKKVLYIVVLLTIAVLGQSREKISPVLNETINKAGHDDNILVWIFFTDKGNETDQYFANPASVVSEKSLKRRMKDIYLKGNVLDFTDLPLNQSYITAVENSGLTLRQKSKWFNGISGYITKENISRIAIYPFVERIDIVYGFKKDYSVVYKDKPADVNKLLQPEGILVYNYGTSFTQLQQINVPAVHNLGYRGQGVTICVMDAGFNRLTHESFIGMNIIAKWDFVNGDPNVGDENDLGSGTHGTQTLSTIGGFKEGKLIGPAFDADYILAKTENTESETPVEEDNWIAAMEWADSIGVDVTSTSLGYLQMDPGFPSYTWQQMNGNTAMITKGADLATHKGIVVVNSAGNEGSNGTPNTLAAPADGDSVIAVGAVSSSGTRASFSSYGPSSDGRIKPDLMAMGSSVYVASPYSNTQYTTASGTSFSCPLAAGAAALVLSYNPNLTPMQVRDALRLTGSRATNPDNYYGWGIINAVNALNYFPLPVELTSFEAYSVKNDVQLKWTTATESNNRGFEIQRAGADKKWQVIGFVDGKGTTSSTSNYSFMDKKTLSGKNIYRLKQIDLDGSFSYSNEVNIDISRVAEYSLLPNFPNPFNPSTTIRYSLPKRVFATLKLYNVLGSELKTLVSQEMDPGIHSYRLDANNLSAGVYFVTMRAENYKKTIKINLVK